MIVRTIVWEVVNTPRLAFLEDFYVDEKIRTLITDHPMAKPYRTSDGRWVFYGILQAIKFVRGYTNWSLVESKQYVELIHDEIIREEGFNGSIHDELNVTEGSKLWHAINNNSPSQA